MTPTLDAALPCSSRAGSDLGSVSGLVCGALSFGFPQADHLLKLKLQILIYDMFQKLRFSEIEYTESLSENCKQYKSKLLFSLLLIYLLWSSLLWLIKTEFTYYKILKAIVDTASNCFLDPMSGSAISHNCSLILSKIRC